MIIRKLTKIAVAAAMSTAPTVAYGAPAAAVQDPAARSSASLADGSAFADESTQVFLGLILVILFAMIVVSGGDRPNNIPASP